MLPQPSLRPLMPMRIQIRTITLGWHRRADGDTLSFKITTLPLNGYLFQTSDGTTKGDTIKSVPTTVTDGSHRVIYLSAKDGNGDGHGNFGFKVNDGTADSEEATVTVNVALVDDKLMLPQRIASDC